MKHIVAVLTDFGTKDYFVGAMKGVILSISEEAIIVDITHDIPPQDIISAGFNLNASYRDFPEKTIFIAVVDPGVGSSRRAILVETESYYFVAPDNGLLSFIYRNETDVRVYELTNEDYFNKPVSNSFHGRDIFAPVAAYLSKGVEPEEFGDEIKDYLELKIRNPKENLDGLLEGEVAHIDRFGNIITNISKDDSANEFSLQIGEHKVFELRQYFSQSAEIIDGDTKSDVFMMFGSLDLLEVVVYGDSAAKILNVEVGDKILITA